MPNQFASGKHAIAECDRCGQRYKLRQLKALTFKRTQTNILVCPTCWEPPQPQVFLGEKPVNDPQALRNPRPEKGYIVGGVGADGEQTGGSRVFQWGWAPVGGSRDGGLTPNNLNLSISIGTVTVSVI
jgi:hypothetical protein